MTYEDNFRKIIESSNDQDFKESMVEQAVHFGQTPIQLFKNPHPKRDTKEKNRNILTYDNIKSRFKDEHQTDGEILITLNSSKYLIFIKYYRSKLFILKLKLKADYHPDFSSAKELELEGTRSLYHENNQNCAPYCVFKDELIFSGNYLDRTLKIHDFDGWLIRSLSYHSAPISAISCIRNKVFTGSADSSIISWKISKNISNPITPESNYTGHLSEVVQLKSSEDYQILISLGSDNSLILHNLRNSELIRKISFECNIRMIDFHESGMIAAGGDQELFIFTLNGDTKECEYQVRAVNSIEFNFNGDLLLLAAENAIEIIDIFGHNDKRVFELDNIIVSAHFSQSQDHIILIQNFVSSSEILSFE